MDRHLIVKMISVTIIATLVSYYSGCTFYLTSGILAMISIQKTKKQSIEITIRRIILVSITVVISSITFNVAHNLGLYFILIIFIVLMGFISKSQVGIIPSVVVLTQLYSVGEVNLAFSIETFMMVFIAFSVTLIFNMFYPSSVSSQLQDLRKQIDMLISQTLLVIATQLQKGNHDFIDLSVSEQHLTSLIQQIEMKTGDLVFSNHNAILEYVYMRQEQYHMLVEIERSIMKLTTHTKAHEDISSYLMKLKDDIGLENKATDQRIIINQLLEDYRKRDLPVSRIEFENRAILYHILLELEEWLLLKIRFHNNSDTTDIKNY
jgi:uncharacterized membrane protein YgaE (UPF0421/DUF939 family)